MRVGNRGSEHMGKGMEVRKPRANQKSFVLTEPVFLRQRGRR